MDDAVSLHDGISAGSTKRREAGFDQGHPAMILAMFQRGAFAQAGGNIGQTEAKKFM